MTFFFPLTSRYNSSDALGGNSGIWENKLSFIFLGSQLLLQLSQVPAHQNALKSSRSRGIPNPWIEFSSGKVSRALGAALWGH